MSGMRNGIWLYVVCFFLFSTEVMCQTSRTPQQSANMVKEQFIHSWSAYMTYAAGHDELLPLNHSYIDYNAYPLMYSAIDGLDTMYLMQLDTEIEQALNLICPNGSTSLFQKNMYVSVFDMTIRLLGGLLSAYAQSGETEDCLKDLAIDLGTRLLPAYTTASPIGEGIPWGTINLMTGDVLFNNTFTNPAIVGTAIIEFGALSYISGNPQFYNVAKQALVSLFNARSKIGLVGDCLNLNASELHWHLPPPPVHDQSLFFCSNSSHICSGIDSYYEYMMKCWVLFGDEDCLQMWNQSYPAIMSYIADFALLEEKNQLWFKRVNMYTSMDPVYNYDLYAAFFAAVLVLAGDIENAIINQNANYYMWNFKGIEPGSFDFISNNIISQYYSLNPENFESNYYLYVNSHNQTYLDHANVYLDDLIDYCKCTAADICVGYTGIDDVSFKIRANVMPSYFFAESLKYLYLTFMEGTPEGSPLNFYDYVFNTEAHPIPKSWGSIPSF